jgi:uncharacterized YigZ family protein
MMDYITVAREAQTETVIQKSRFIGWCIPVSGEEEAIRQLESRKKQYRDATHNCHAYITGEMGQTTRSSDDGEPSGTAGVPILEAIKHKGLTNTLVVVTRYFGGILLGAGGLVRAYSGAASSALEAAGLAHYATTEAYRVETGYPEWNRLENALKNMPCMIDQVEFTELVHAIILVRKKDSPALLSQVSDWTDGKVKPVLAGESSKAWNSDNV